MARRLAVWLLLVLVIAFASAQPPERRESIDVETITGSKYLTFLAGVDTTVAATTTASENVVGHPLLGPQNLRVAPAVWIMAQLTNKRGQILVTLPIRSDNLYVAGFSNRFGKYFAFSDQQSTIPGSTALSFTGQYSDIFGPGGYRGVGRVGISKAQTLSHALVLANYPKTPAPDAALKAALGYFILTVSEAERFPDIHNNVAANIGGATPRPLAAKLVPLTVNWKRVSCALRSWERHGRTLDSWARKGEANELKAKAGVPGPTEALRIVGPLLRSSDCSWTPS